MLQTKREDHKIQLFDTAGCLRWLKHLVPYIQMSDGVLLFYSVRDGDALEQIDARLVVLHHELQANTPIVLLATHCDIHPEQREITYQQGLDFAKRRRLAGFFECSALSGVNVEKSLQHLLSLIVNHDDPEEEMFGDVATHDYMPVDGWGWCWLLLLLSLSLLLLFFLLACLFWVIVIILINIIFVLGTLPV